MSKVKKMIEQKNVGEKPIYERIQLANLLNVNVRTVDRLEKKGIIKGYKLEGLDKKKFFKYADIYKAIFSEEVEENGLVRA